MSITTFLEHPPMRGALWLSLTDQARFMVRGTASDGGGGVTETYTPAGTADWATTTNYDCRIDVVGGREGESADRISDRSTHIVTFHAGTITGLSMNSKLQIQNRGRYEITAIHEHTGEMATQIEVTDLTI